MTCGLTSSGRADWIPAMAVCRRWVASSMSVPYVNSMVVSETPVDAVERTDAIPSIEAIASSITSVTCSSTTSGDEPWYCALTIPVGSCRDGISSCFNPVILSTPNTRYRHRHQRHDGSVREGKPGEMEHEDSTVRTRIGQTARRRRRGLGRTNGVKPTEVTE